VIAASPLAALLSLTEYKQYLFNLLDDPTCCFCIFPPPYALLRDFDPSSSATFSSTSYYFAIPQTDFMLSSSSDSTSSFSAPTMQRHRVELESPFEVVAVSVSKMNDRFYVIWNCTCESYDPVHASYFAHLEGRSFNECFSEILPDIDPSVLAPRCIHSAALSGFLTEKLKGNFPGLLIQSLSSPVCATLPFYATSLSSFFLAFAVLFDFLLLYFLRGIF
jgi:hypothetical protein